MGAAFRPSERIERKKCPHSPPPLLTLRPYRQNPPSPSICPLPLTYYVSKGHSLLSPLSPAHSTFSSRVTGAEEEENVREEEGEEEVRETQYEMMMQRGGETQEEIKGYSRRRRRRRRKSQDSSRLLLHPRLESKYCLSFRLSLLSEEGREGRGREGVNGHIKRRE